MSKGKQILVLIVCLLGVIGLGINWAFFDTQRIQGEELLESADSPNKNYTVSAYLNNGGATTDYAVLCTLRNNENGKKKNIYWMSPCENVSMEWLNDETVKINGIELDVEKDVYDFRKNF